MALTPRQYLSHILLNLGCPPMSHTFVFANITPSYSTTQKLNSINANSTSHYLHTAM